MAESAEGKVVNVAAGKEGTAKQSADDAPKRPARGRRAAGGGGRVAAARRRRGGAGAGAGGGGLRGRLLEALQKVEKGDTLIEGTQIGEKQLEKFMGLLDKIESGERGRKMKDKAQELLSPVETDEGFTFSPEGVKKLVAFLEEAPAKQGGARRRAAGRAGAAGAGIGAGVRAGTRGRGRAGAGRAGARGARRPGARLR
jgi:hypothetical protein